jgi:hypothetical protein
MMSRILSSLWKRLSTWCAWLADTRPTTLWDLQNPLPMTMADEDPRYWDPALDDISRAYDPDTAPHVLDRLWAQRMAEGLSELGKKKYTPEKDEDIEVPMVDIPVDLELAVVLELGGTEVAMCLEAWAHFEDHDCEWGMDALAELGGLVCDEIKRRLIQGGHLDESWDPDAD